MTTRWDVESALMWSNIRPMARLVMLALLTKADTLTAVVPEEHTPSTKTLAAMTGLSRSVVAEQLPYLCGLDWLKVSSPAKRSKYDRNLYALMVGRPDPKRPSCPAPGQLNESVQVTSCPGAGQLPGVREADSSDAAETQRAVWEPDTSDSQLSGSQTARDQPSGPGAGHATTTTSSTSKSTPSASALFDVKPAGPADPPKTDNAGKILASWIDWNTNHGVKLTKRVIGHYATEIKSLIDQEFPPELIRSALAILFEENNTGKPSLLSNKIVEAQGRRRQRTRASPATGLVEVNGRLLKPDTARLVDDDERWAAEDAARAQRQQPAIEGIVP